MVSHGGVLSDVVVCRAGVPQGSKFGPTLFTLLMNDIEEIDLEGDLFCLCMLTTFTLFTGVAMPMS